MSTDEPTSDEENGRIDLQHCSMEGGVVISDTTAKKGGASKWGPKREVVSQITTGSSSQRLRRSLSYSFHSVQYYQENMSGMRKLQDLLRAKKKVRSIFICLRYRYQVFINYMCGFVVPT